MAERSRHQQKIIKNYYDNRESIALQRLQDCKARGEVVR